MTQLVARPDTIWSYQFRIVLLGDSTVGKSALLRRFTDGCYSEISDPTVGVDFYSRIIEITPCTRIRLQLWDTAGQERFRSITRSYYRDSIGAILVYDITNRDSFEHVCNWAEEAKLHVAPRQIYFALVGQKKDLAQFRKVPTVEARTFARHHKMPFTEASAKEGVSILESFLLLTELIYRLVKSGEINVEEGWNGVRCGLVPSDNVDEFDRRKSCCN